MARLVDNDELFNEITGSINNYIVHKYKYYDRYDYLLYVLSTIFYESRMYYICKSSSYIGYYSHIVCIEYIRTKYIKKIFYILINYFPKDIVNIIIKYAIKPVYLIYIANDVIKIKNIFKPLLFNHNDDLLKHIFRDGNQTDKTISNEYILHYLDLRIITNINNIYEDSNKYHNIMNAKTFLMKRIKKWLKHNNVENSLNNN